MHKITDIKVLPDYRLEIAFSDGKRGVADLSHLVGKGVFSLWNDYEAFRNVKIGSFGELLWSDQVDICPDSLYLQVTRQKADDVFPHLKRELAHA